MDSAVSQHPIRRGARVYGHSCLSLVIVFVVNAAFLVIAIAEDFVNRSICMERSETMCREMKDSENYTNLLFEA